MKKFLALAMAGSMAFSLAACGGNSASSSSAAGATSSATAEEAAASEITGIAQVCDVGTIDDESFNQATWQGVVEFCEANGVEYNYYQPTEDSNDARLVSITTAIADGYDVIVMPGYLFGATLGEAQNLYGDKAYFIAIDVGEGDLGGAVPGAKTTCFTFAEEQAGYLAGYAVVKDGYTKLGFLGGIAVPAVQRYGYGFIQGADAAAQELGITVDMKYTYGNTFSADPAITAKMEGWYQSGTEIVFACGGGIYGSAVEAAVQYEGMVVGVDVDQHYIGESESYPYNPFVTSAMKGLQSTTVSVLSDLFSGNFSKYAGQINNLSLAEGDYVGLPTAESSWGFKTFTLDEYNAVLEKIKSGEIVVSNDVSAMPETTAVTVEEIQ